MADWEVALEKQLDTWLFYTSDNGRGHLDGYVASVDRKYEDGAYARAMANGIEKALWVADPIYVTRDMMSVLEAAWPGFEPEPLREEDLLVPYGFVYLPRPVQTIDVAGNLMTHRGIAWMQALDTNSDRRGLVVYTFGGPNDPDDYKSLAIKEHGERYERDFVRFFGQSLALGHMTTLWYGEEWWRSADSIDFIVAQGDDTMVRDQETVTASNRAIAQFLGAMWRLLNQQVGVGFRQRANRATRKRVAHARMDEKYITVVTLRRPRAEQTGEHRNVDWQQRWIVSGHWRWQPYKDGVRQIWIAPYVKGPDDKPLVVRGARVFRLAR